MISYGVELALGTAQFGMKYGIAGRGEAVPPAEVREIVALAWSGGVRLIDTAAAYGEIEERIEPMLQDRPFVFVSKIAALPAGSSKDAITSFVDGSIRRSRVRLGAGLQTILFHRGEDLLGPHGELAWQTAVATAADIDVRLGASCYSPAEAAALRSKFPIAVTQIPGNALDQRLTSGFDLADVEVHLRSVFLQGLLLLSPDQVLTRVPGATHAVTNWQRWCSEQGLTPLCAALGVAKALPRVRYCIVGVDRPAQLEEILMAWERTGPLPAPMLASADQDVIDPRRWRN